MNAELHQHTMSRLSGVIEYTLRRTNKSFDVYKQEIELEKALFKEENGLKDEAKLSDQQLLEVKNTYSYAKGKSIATSILNNIERSCVMTQYGFDMSEELKKNVRLTCSIFFDKYCIRSCKDKEMLVKQSATEIASKAASFIIEEHTPYYVNQQRYKQNGYTENQLRKRITKSL